MKKYKTVLTIAGSDSSGGAGIQADIKAISACGCYASSVITALTAQNTVGVRMIELPSVEMFVAQLEATLDDIEFDAVKIGMLPSEEFAVALRNIIEKYSLKNIVLDPVMVATSRDKLVDDTAAQSIIREIMPYAELVTPNIPEAEYISGVEIQSLDDFNLAAEKILSLGAKSVLIKGGHSEQNNSITDRLFCGKNHVEEFVYPFVDSKNTHGTGCSLSSSIASYLAHGEDIIGAVSKADDYLHKALEAAKDYSLGKGHGPVNHFLL
ncbi:MAG: bifunctional hydroxymethylpyrimidine kinase/phosphomethylpyrimidine kinase [Rikenellaceae bacterium]